MITQTVERQNLHRIIDTLPEEQIPAALDLIKDFYGGDETPNAETAAIIANAFAGDVSHARTRQGFFDAMHQSGNDEDTLTGRMIYSKIDTDDHNENGILLLLRLGSHTELFRK
ncbi:hypothetical protein FACS1894216_14330 [Synergistales bacterium]|nr:hypothetical protein FACS1894216_14330 [Synergistales bacterium]